LAGLGVPPEGQPLSLLEQLFPLVGRLVHINVLGHLVLVLVPVATSWPEPGGFADLVLGVLSVPDDTKGAASTALVAAQLLPQPHANSVPGTEEPLRGGCGPTAHRKDRCGRALWAGCGCGGLFGWEALSWNHHQNTSASFFLLGQNVTVDIV